MKTSRTKGIEISSNTTSLFPCPETLARTDLEFWNDIQIRGQAFVPKPGTQSTVWTRDPQIEHRDIDPLKKLENSTEKTELSEELDQKIKTLFAEAEDLDFEVGMKSKFSNEFIYLIKKHGNSAVAIISNLIIYEKVNEKVAIEALRWIGHVDHHQSYQFRIWLLERCLNSSFANIRDSASLGLAHLNDPQAIPYLEKAIKKEPRSSLRQDMEEVLAQLKDENAFIFKEDRQ